MAMGKPHSPAPAISPSSNWVKPYCWPQAPRRPPRTAKPMPPAISVKKLAQNRTIWLREGVAPTATSGGGAAGGAPPAVWPSRLRVQAHGRAGFRHLSDPWLQYSLGVVLGFSCQAKSGKAKRGAPLRRSGVRAGKAAAPFPHAGASYDRDYGLDGIRRFADVQKKAPVSRDAERSAFPERSAPRRG